MRVLICVTEPFSTVLASQQDVSQILFDRGQFVQIQRSMKIDKMALHQFFCEQSVVICKRCYQSMVCVTFTQRTFARQ